MMTDKEESNGRSVQMSLGATKRTVNTQGMMRSAQKSRQILARCLFEFPQLSVDLARYPPCTGLNLYVLPPSLLRVHAMPTSFHAVSLGSGIQDTTLKWRLSATGQRKGIRSWVSFER